MNAVAKAASTIAVAHEHAERVEALDWERVSQDLDAQGSAHDRAASFSGGMRGDGRSVPQ